jgi:hypothetical protein
MEPPDFDLEPEGDNEEDHRVVRMVLDGHAGRGRAPVVSHTFRAKNLYGRHSFMIGNIADMMRESKGERVPDVFHFVLI